MSKKKKNKEVVEVQNESALEQYLDASESLGQDPLEVNPLVKKETSSSLEEAKEITKEIKQLQKEVAAVKPQAQEQKINIHDACRRYVIGYKEFWLPSIKKFAASEGHSDSMTIEEAKAVLKKWGAKLN